MAAPSLKMVGEKAAVLLNQILVSRHKVFFPSANHSTRPKIHYIEFKPSGLIDMSGTQCIGIDITFRMRVK